MKTLNKLHDQHFRLDLENKTVHTKGVHEVEEQSFTFKSLQLLADTFMTDKDPHLKGYARFLYFMKDQKIIIG